MERIFSFLEKLDAKLDEVKNTIVEIKIEQTRQNTVVSEHERRSTASEGRLDLLESGINERLAKLEKDSQFARNFLTTISIIAGMLVFIVKILPLFVH